MTSTIEAVEGVIKTDVLGRMRTSAERREGLLKEFDQSGLSGKKFAELAGIKYQTLATWLQKRRKLSLASAQTAGPAKWLEAVVEQAQLPVVQNGAVLRLQLPGGVSVELSDVKQAPLAVALLRALAQSC
jgi:transposase